METHKREKLLQVTVDLAQHHAADIDTMLVPMGVAPKWPSPLRGRRVPIWSGLDANDENSKQVHLPACRVVATLGCTDAQQQEGMPDATVREEELKALLGKYHVAIPEWIGEQDKLDRWTLLAVLAAAAAAQNPSLHDALLAPGGVVHLWLEGNGDARKGLVAKIPAPGSALSEAVTAHYRAVIGQPLVRAEDE